MAGRGAQSFQKRQKEQQRKEKQEEKRMKRFQKKDNRGAEAGGEGDSPDIGPLEHPEAEGDITGSAAEPHPL